MNNPNNINKSKDTLILVTSFGTAYAETREKTIGAIERAIENAFPNLEVRRAFTSQTILNKLKDQDGIEIDNVSSALKKAATDGFSTIIIQPTFLTYGKEYEELVGITHQHTDAFKQIIIGKPLLADEEDFHQVIKAITDLVTDLTTNLSTDLTTGLSTDLTTGLSTDRTTGLSTDRIRKDTTSKVPGTSLTGQNTATVLMGHGTITPHVEEDKNVSASFRSNYESKNSLQIESRNAITPNDNPAIDANSVYPRLQSMLRKKGHHNYYIGTMKASVSIDAIIEELKKDPSIKYVILQALLVTCGGHVNNDMIGTKKDSWKSLLESAGYQVIPVLKGLGELKEIQEIYVQHVADSLPNCMAIPVHKL